jgi:hypothetical protein
MSNIDDYASTDWKQWLEFYESKWEIIPCKDNPKPQRKDLCYKFAVYD